MFLLLTSALGPPSSMILTIACFRASMLPFHLRFVISRIFPPSLGFFSLVAATCVYRFALHVKHLRMSLLKLWMGGYKHILVSASVQAYVYSSAAMYLELCFWSDFSLSA